MHNISPLYRLFFCLLVLAVVTTAGCANTAAPTIGATAPAISCTDVRGDYFSLGQLKGQVVVLLFWSSTCCSESVKKLQTFVQDQQGKGVALVAVEVGGTKEAVASFVADNKLSFTNLIDEYGSISKTYRVVGFPTIFIVDAKGAVQRKVSGEIGVDQLGRLVDQIR